MVMEHLNISSLIVDDESGVRRSLLSKIKRETKEMDFLIEEASSAEEAYKIIKNKKIHLLFLDMRMPGMGGMKFLEILNEEFPVMKVVVVSGFSDFHYVKHALKFGATDYLLKPIVKEELKKTLNQIIQTLAFEQNEKENEQGKNALFNEGLPLLENHLLNRLLKNPNQEATNILKKLSYLQINMDFKYYMLVLINIKKFKKVKSSTVYPDAVKLFSIIEKELNQSFDKNAHVSFKSSIRENEYICVFEIEDYHQKCIEKLKEHLKQFNRNIETKRKLFLNVVVSDIFNNVSDVNEHYIRSSYHSNMERENDDFSSKIVFLNEVEEEVVEEDLLSQEDYEALKKFVKTNDKRNISTKVNSLFEMLSQGSLLETKKLADSLYKVFEGVINDFPEYYRERAYYKLPPYNYFVISINNMQTTQFEVIKIFYEICNYYNKIQKQDNIIYRIKGYIDEHFYEEITLEYISTKFYINPTYLSDQFKKVIGLNFKKYLNNVRIDKAKELLLQQNMKPVQVSELVGFKDPIHFSTVFKKYVGIPPGKFQEENKKY